MGGGAILRMGIQNDAASGASRKFFNFVFVPIITGYVLVPRLPLY